EAGAALQGGRPDGAREARDGAGRDVARALDHDVLVVLGAAVDRAVPVPLVDLGHGDPDVLGAPALASDRRVVRRPLEVRPALRIWGGDRGDGLDVDSGRLHRGEAPVVAGLVARDLAGDRDGGAEGRVLLRERVEEDDVTLRGAGGDQDVFLVALVG